MVKKRKGKHPGGRPLEYNADKHPEQVYMLAREGLSISAIARGMQINRDTFYDWKHKYKEFSDKYFLGHDEFGLRLAENSIKLRMAGTKYTETTKEPGMLVDAYGNPVIGFDGKPVIGLVATKSVTKVVQPSDRAIEFYLTRRDPDRWPSAKKLEISGPDGGPLDSKVTHDMDVKQAMELFKSKVKGGK